MLSWNLNLERANVSELMGLILATHTAEDTKLNVLRMSLQNKLTLEAVIVFTILEIICQFSQLFLCVFGIVLYVLKDIGSDLVILFEDNIPHSVHVIITPIYPRYIVVAESTTKDVLHQPDNLF
jgi:hypothetical protein